MMPILEMDLEILHAHPGTRSIQLPGTIMTAQSGKILILDIGRRVGRVDGLFGRLVGEDVDGGVAHHSFEGVAWVARLEGREAVCKPCWRWGLGRG